MAKPSEPKKPAAKSVNASSGAAKRSSEEAVSSKENPNPAKTKSGNTPETRLPSQVQGKAAPSPRAGAKANDHTEATGRDHPSQSEHAKALWQKLHGTSDQRTKGGPPGAGKKGFDPKQLKGGAKNFGGAAGNQMLRRTQGKGGGGGGGGGGGAGA